MADGFTPPPNQQPPQGGGFPPPPPPNFGQPGQYQPPAGQFGQPGQPAWNQQFPPQAGGFPPPPPPQFNGQPQQFQPPYGQPQFAQPQYGHGDYAFPPQPGQQPQYGGFPPPPPPQFQQPGQQFQPPYGQPGQFAPPPAAGAPTPPAPAPAIDSPLQTDEELSEDQFITGGDDHSFIKTIPIPPHPATQFEEKKFLDLLAGSISLTKTEKQRIISSIPKLSQYQIDELMRIFAEEQKKFQELNAKHLDQVKQLEESHKSDWQDIEMQAKQQTQKQKDDDDADALRKKLGLG